MTDIYEKALDVTSDWNVSEQEYRDYPALNFHTLANFRRDPRAWKDGFFEMREATDAMRFGTALHARVLEGDDVYAEKVAVFNAPINEKTGEVYGATTKAYKEAYQSFVEKNAGKILIGSSDAETIDKLTQAYYFHPTAPKVLGMGANGFRHTEMCVKGKWLLGDNEIEVKGRVDCYGDQGLVDVKTTSALDDASGRDRFRYAIYDFKYLVQLGFYHRLLTDCLHTPYVPCWIVAFERNAPNRVAVYKISESVLEKARLVAWEWISAYSRAQATEYYGSRFDDVQLIDFYNHERDV